MLRNWFSKFHDFIFSNVCLFCGEKSQRTIALCFACEADLPWQQKVCVQCAMPLEGVTLESEGICAGCLKHPPLFQRSLALFNYEFPINHIITSLKFQAHLEYAKLLSDLMADKIMNHWYRQHVLPEVIIPVPLHEKRLRERGFNQAVEISREIAKKLSLKIDVKSCQRIKFTVMQSELSAPQRLNNMKNAFMVNVPQVWKHVAILDDVVTTGHTVAELTKALKKTGVERIDIWCCARTIIDRAQ